MGYSIDCLCCLWDPETYLWYDAVKIVPIRDRSLGLVRLLLLLPLFGYFVCYILIAEGRFLLQWPTTGSVYAALSRATTSLNTYCGSGTNPNTCVYCSTYTDGSYTGKDLYPYSAYSTAAMSNVRKDCVMDDYLSQGPADINTKMVDIPLRVRTTFYQYGCSANAQCSTLYTAYAPNVNVYGSLKTTSATIDYFTLSPEDYTMTLYHWGGSMGDYKHLAEGLSTAGTTGAYFYNGGKSTATAYKSDGSVYKTWASDPYEKHSLTLTDILTMANIDLQEPTGPYNSIEYPFFIAGSSENIRRSSGVVIYVLMEYNNLEKLSADLVTCRISARVQNGIGSKSVEKVIMGDALDKAAVIERTTAKIIFVSKGYVGTFDTVTLTMQLTLTFGLITFVSFCTDLVTFYLLPLRHLYYFMVYEKTAEVKGMEEKLEFLKNHNDAKLLKLDQRYGVGLQLFQGDTQVTKVAPVEIELEKNVTKNKRAAELVRLKLIRGQRDRSVEAVPVEDSEIQQLFRLVTEDAGNPYVEKKDMLTIFKDFHIPHDPDMVLALVEMLQKDKAEVLRDVQAKKEAETEGKQKKMGGEGVKSDVEVLEDHAADDEGESKEEDEDEILRKKLEEQKAAKKDSKQKVYVISEDAFSRIVRVHKPKFDTRAKIQIDWYLKVEFKHRAEEEKDIIDRGFSEYAASNQTANSNGDYITIDQATMYMSTVKVAGKNISTSKDERLALLEQYSDKHGHLTNVQFLNLVILLKSSFRKIYAELVKMKEVNSAQATKGKEKEKKWYELPSRWDVTRERVKQLDAQLNNFRFIAKKLLHKIWPDFDQVDESKWGKYANDVKGAKKTCKLQ